MIMNTELRTALIDAIRDERDSSGDRTHWTRIMTALMDTTHIPDGHVLAPTTDMAEVDGDVDITEDRDGCIEQVIEFFGLAHLAVAKESNR
ncbi:hypothetical protein [Amycolatopsis sp. WQ 127309]|uniref:hypothetical protein n=1 Tax=Amycolatopsis sp. WQ 127309 TaxID=2932773 RepID=UPI001FF5F4F3|nr:hypothetical protein [Amycolatopsis sp. WQ 127309]UOZ10554.1 hypothetical protein MUY22_20725 [Amycolatopsis sp. WQ 127309]